MSITMAKPQGSSKVRYLILLMIFVITVINYADRSTLSLTGTTISHEFGLSPKELGLIFSAFGWAYAIGQVPGGWFLDRFGSKLVYGGSLFLWSLCTFCQGLIGNTFHFVSLIFTFFFFRFMLGLVESPAFPANSRVVATWFPTKERGLASSAFNSAQYFGTIIFAPIMGWLVTKYSWHYVYFFMGGIGFILVMIWAAVELNPLKNKRVSAAELEHMRAGGALIDLDQKKPVVEQSKDKASQWEILKVLLTNRMLVGVYIGQYCITALSYFFITWFPIYLIKGRGMSIMEAGMVAAIPAICGFSGGMLGGIVSDILIRRGFSNTVARKIPFTLGMFFATTLVFCNFVDAKWVVIMLMAFAFFGKGLAAIGWAVIADTAPKEAIGLTGGVFNGLGNIAGIITPLVIGYIVDATGSFSGALYFVAAHSLLAMFSYLVIVGPIQRIQIKTGA
ncbi:MFS transporter [Acinetobacter sp. ME22]|uniref:MFS transporter n=1 Tax=Acinetobacter sp. ME22 TaxID=2904802 RepID=UPI001EDBD485|nr:MFS transporter [Acinetobacter sp. ME22]MCG2574808.1 MFS transporter [Acinetobacter sp. ME22]